MSRTRSKTDPGAALGRFSAATRAWFCAAFAEPTPAQVGAWEAISAGQHTLVVAPTGSGKTLAAFLWALDRLANEPVPAEALRRCRVLYVSPLKALAVDVQRNLRSPLVGISRAAGALGLAEPAVTVATRSGDTPAADRRAFARAPADVLITTPESLFLLLTSSARTALSGVQTVILDEVHAVAGTKRGAHLALTLERLDALLERPAQRIGLSATVRPVEEVARFLAGGRPVSVVAPPLGPAVDVEVVVPVEDMSAPAAPVSRAAGAAGAAGAASSEPSAAALPSIWPHVEERIVDLIDAHRSTIVFANSRRLAERLTSRLNEIAWERASGEQLPDPGALTPAAVMANAGASRGLPEGGELARAHHGSVSKEQRARIEEDLKAGRLPAVVATSSLELGIDMGAVDLVVQVEAPPSVASGLQRVGRAGHAVGERSRGTVFPKHRSDLLATAAVVERMRGGQIEATRAPRNPLDVLAQQVVAMLAMDSFSVEELAELVRRAAPFAELPDSALHAVLDMLAGRYPSDEFAELRPRIVWDRVSGQLTGRPGAQRLAVTSGGTIPDRGLFGVFLVGERAVRVGELDEEMVYESRVGDVFTLGTSAWRVEEITHDRVLVSPSPGQPGRLPFWHGDALGRPAELGRAIGALTRELGGPDRSASHRRLAQAGLDELAVSNLLGYLDEQLEATGSLPDDHTVVVESVRDELGDWQVVVHSPFGAQLNAPWALVLAARARERFGVDVAAMHADDGIVLRLPDLELPDSAPPQLADLLVIDPDRVAEAVQAEVGGSALFAARFRECAARALLMPRRSPGRRTPLWRQRQRAAQLLEVASQYASFPIVLETVREVLQDVYDVPALVELMREVAQRRVRIVEVATATPSPFARSLLFGYVAAFLYEGDSPLAERRAAALALDSAMLAELLGRVELRELLDPDALAQVEAELARLAPERAARDREGLADLLRLLGPLSEAEVLARCQAGPGEVRGWLVELAAARRAIEVRVAGETRWAAVEDAARLRDALGTALPVGVPEAFLEPVPDPLGDLVSRFARTHGPFSVAELAARLGVGVSVAGAALQAAGAAGRVVSGEFRPGGAGTEWCDTEVLRRVRSRSMAVLRRQIEPVPARTLGRFLPRWQAVGSRLTGTDGLLAVIDQLAGAPLPASGLEPLVLGSRVRDYSPGLLDGLTASGEVVWLGAGRAGPGDGWVTLMLAEHADLLRPEPDPAAVAGPLHEAVLAALSGGGGWFFRQLSDAVACTDDAWLEAALWDLLWGGHLTNDTLAPLRTVLSGRPGRSRSARPVPLSPARASGPGATRRHPGAGRVGRARMPSRTGPATAAGRWSLPGPAAPAPDTERAYARAEALLARYGVLTRPEVTAERVPGGFAGLYPVLSALEDAGRVRRGYVLAGLGAAQFAVPGAVDRVRAEAGDARAGDAGLVLAAGDPANPYGAALPWPERPEAGTGHRPSRAPGALVVLVEGDLTIYVERGGRSLLTWGEPGRLETAVTALATAVLGGALARLDLERVDGVAVGTSPLAGPLQAAGFRATPRGMRLRG